MVLLTIPQAPLDHPAPSLVRYSFFVQAMLWKVGGIGWQWLLINSRYFYDLFELPGIFFRNTLGIAARRYGRRWFTLFTPLGILLLWLGSGQFLIHRTLADKPWPNPAKIHVPASTPCQDLSCASR